MALECICQTTVDTANPQEIVRDAAERMHQRSVGALVVIDESKRPIGIVTDRDLAIRVTAAGRDSSGTTVREVMTHPAKTIPRSADVDCALEMMRAGAFRRLPVVDERGQLAGIVTLDDILLQTSMRLGSASAILRAETPQAAAAP